MTNIIFKQNHISGRLQRDMLKRCGFVLFFSAVVILVTACGGGGGGTTSVLAPTVKAWGTAALIETDNAGDALIPQVAFDSSGNALAVWRQNDGTRYNIWANRYDVITGWGSAELIEASDGIAYGPQVVFDSSGNALAVWHQAGGSGLFTVWANRYIAGVGWGSAVEIESSVADTQSVQVAVDGNGNALAVWEQSATGPRFDIWANRYDASADLWGAAELIETDNAGDAQRPQLAFDGSGNALAVWEQDDGTRRNIWANRYVAGTGWTGPVLIETDNAGNARFPQLAIDSNGDALAVWHQSDGTRMNIWANRYDFVSGLWGTAALIETNDVGDALFPQLAFDGSGNALAVWDQSDGTRRNIWANRYVAGTGWSSAALIEVDNAGEAIHPKLAVDSSGSAFAMWSQNDGTRYNVWANHYVAGTGWGSAELIEVDNAGSAVNPQVAVDNSGNALAVWDQNDGTRRNIWANRFQ